MNEWMYTRLISCWKRAQTSDVTIKFRVWCYAFQYINVKHPWWKYLTRSPFEFCSIALEIMSTTGGIWVLHPFFTWFWGSRTDSKDIKLLFHYNLWKNVTNSPGEIGESEVIDGLVCSGHSRQLASSDAVHFSECWSNNVPSGHSIVIHIDHWVQYKYMLQLCGTGSIWP